jgi:hypothetical protein
MLSLSLPTRLARLSAFLARLSARACFRAAFSAFCDFSSELENFFFYIVLEGDATAIVVFGENLWATGVFSLELEEAMAVVFIDGNWGVEEVFSFELETFSFFFLLKEDATASKDETWMIGAREGCETSGVGRKSSSSVSRISMISGPTA